MKKIVFLTFLLVFSNSFSQELEKVEKKNRRDIKKNELSLNVFSVLIFGAFEASYERILSNRSSLALDFFSKKLDRTKGEELDLSRAYSKEFSLTSKFKYFFREEKTAWGFYAEAFGMYSDGINDKKVEIAGEGETEIINIEYTDFALGLGLGGKFASKKGFLIDLSFGLGRNMFHRDSPDLVVLPNINLGYRF